MRAAASRRHNLALGISFILIGTVFIALTDALGKWLTASYPIMQIAFVRSIFGITLIAVFAIATGCTGQLRTRQPGWHLFRGVLSVAAMIGLFYGLKHIPLAEFIAIVFSAPFFIALLSPRFLSEHVSRRSWIAIALGFVGILLVAHPAPGHFHIAHLTTLSVTALIAILVVSARYLSTSETPLALNFYMYPLNIIVPTGWAIRDWVPPTATDWLLLFAIGLTSTLAVACGLQAMRHARPATIAPLDYTRLVWITLLGYFIWGEWPGAITWIGILVIVTAGIYVVTHGRTIPQLEVEASERMG
ncbi:MAG: DMT family transporter [Gammaproteobacteria bacterium]|nr:DMT family transporter [Gammaproteobacteria bacterium]